MASIFTKIIKGELPCYKIFENDKSFAFLALYQITLGHTLVIPKIEVDHFIDSPYEDYLSVMKSSYKIAKAIHRAIGCKRVLTCVQGFEVPHFHQHLIPGNDPSDLNFKKAREYPEDIMKSIQEKILKELSL